MKKILLAVIVIAVLANSSFAASPPPKFLGEKINTFIGNLATWGEVGELVQCLKDNGNSVNWESAGNSWILHSKNTDKLTKKVNKVDWLLEEGKIGDDIKRVYMTRVVVNKEEIRPTVILSSNAVMACWKKEIAQAEQESKRQAAKDEEERIEREKAEEKTRLAEIEAEKERDRLEAQAEERRIESEEKVRVAEAERLKEKAKLQARVASLERQKAVARLTGHYENKQKIDAVSRGSLDVTSLSNDKIKFSLHNKSGSAPCDIDDQEAVIDYSGKKRESIVATFGDETQARRDKEACFIRLNFRDSGAQVKERMGYDFSVEVDQRGCRSYCGRGGTMLGRYIKVPTDL